MRQYGRDDVDYDTWFSEWAKRLAREHTRDELEAMLGRARGESDRAARTHLRAIERTTSMSSQSQARAHARNAVAASGETALAIRSALNIHDLFPEHAKGAPAAPPRNQNTPEGE